MSDSIPKQVLQQLKQIGTETVEKSVEAIGQIGSSVISGKELLGLKPMTAGEYQQKQQEDNQKKQQEMSDVRSQMSVRNVGQEIEQVRDEKEQKEDEEERQMLENVKRQREEEEIERAQMVQAPGNVKRNVAKHQGQRGKKKSNQPDPAAMSQTSEIKGKID